jgi:hypothetical protein
MFKKTFLAVALISCSVASFAAQLVFSDLPTGYSGTYANHQLKGDDTFSFNNPLQQGQQLSVVGNNDNATYSFSYETISNTPTLVIQYIKGYSSNPLAVRVKSSVYPQIDYCLPAKLTGQSLNVLLSDGNTPLPINSKLVVSVVHGC